MLIFGTPPPFSFNKLAESCKGLIPDEDIAVLRDAVSGPVEQCCAIKNDTVMKWRSFDTMLRNELVKIRASRKREDPAGYMRRDGCPESIYAAHIAMNAYRKPSILEAEKALDLERWRELDGLAFGHYFDIDALIVYGCKLRILEKWQMVNTADTKRLLEDNLAPAAS
jgi:hypothetical protein